MEHRTLSSVDLRKWTASWAASEFTLDHVTSAKGLTHISGGNKQYYSLNQKPTREECSRKEPRELPFFFCQAGKVMELCMKIESDTVEFDNHCMEATCYTQARDHLQLPFI